MTIYENGKIYKIEPINGGDVGDVYYGSTTKTLLSQRMTQHKYEFNKWKKGQSKHKTTSFDIFEKFGTDNCQIVLVENVENCKSKNELHAREGYYIKNFNCINQKIPARTRQEYKKDNEVEIKKQNKTYRELHKDEIKNYRELHKDEMKHTNKLYYQEHQEKIIKRTKKYYEENKDSIHLKAKAYAERHAEELQTYHKQYYQDCAEKIKEKHKERITCICGLTYTYGNKSCHIKSKKHQTFLCGNV